MSSRKSKAVQVQQVVESLPVTVAAVPMPAPRASVLPKPTRLHNLRAVKRDATKIYRAARHGLIDSSELGRWMFASGSLSTLIEKSDMEPRIAAIEERLNKLLAALDQRVV